MIVSDQRFYVTNARKKDIVPELKLLFFLYIILIYFMELKCSLVNMLTYVLSKEWFLFGWSTICVFYVYTGLALVIFSDSSLFSPLIHSTSPPHLQTPSVESLTGQSVRVITNILLCCSRLSYEQLSYQCNLVCY